MHRQGFLPKDVPRLLRKIKRYKIVPTGIYTHFASAKDAAYPTYTREQFARFKEVIAQFEKAGFPKLIRHAAASGGTLLFPETHLDMVRIGMSLYGYWPSPEAKISSLLVRSKDKSQKIKKLELTSALSWYTFVVETKKIKKGSYVGYDLTERVSRDTQIAVLPIGYWHGYDRGLSNIGEVLVRGRRARVLGRVCMDMVVIDVTEINGVKVGDKVTLIGKSRRGVGTPTSPSKSKNRASGQKKEELWADELALKIGTSQYEFLTRVNPLIKRLLI
jgi:alanine racemase